VRAADDLEVAPAASALARRRRQDAPVERAVDRFEHLKTPAPAERIQWNNAIGVTARGGAEGETGLDHGPAEHGFDCQTVEDWLKPPPLPDHEPRFRRVAAGLVVGNAQLATAAAALDRIDDAVKQPSALERHGCRRARRVHFARDRQAEPELESERLP